MTSLDMLQIQYTWIVDIVRRIELVLQSDTYSDKEKLVAIQWFIKQAGKVERED